MTREFGSPPGLPGDERAYKKEAARMDRLRQRRQDADDRLRIHIKIEQAEWTLQDLKARQARLAATGPMGEDASAIFNRVFGGR